MKLQTLAEAMSASTYPGRGIVAGLHEDGRSAVIAYFIMGRSPNSRNRVFVPQGAYGLRTEAFDPSRMEDPSLIIYSPVRTFSGHTVVSNGDQTDTIMDYLKNGKSFMSALRSRTFEPDAPNYTPRISALIRTESGTFRYKLSILKSADGNPDECERFFYMYDQPRPGIGHFIHTYKCDGDPVIPSFEGEPEPVSLTGTIDQIARDIWDHLDRNNKVSLFVRTIDLKTNAIETRIINKNH